jgi:SAM-dependent methyltransferase
MTGNLIRRMSQHSKRLMESVEFYNQHAEQFYEDTISIDMRELYAPFISLIPKGSEILDAGCGSGRDSLFFIQQGYKVTAFDASAALVELSTRLIHQEVLQLRFHELKFDNQFNAVWACASLLHVPRTHIDEVLSKLANALKSHGVLYASFKYGDMEFEADGRLFNCYDEFSFSKLVAKHSKLALLRSWKSKDLRPSKCDEFWLNALLRRC